MKTNKCTIVAEISVFTKYPGRKTTKHGQFERRVEGILKSCYAAYMKHLVNQIPGKHTWKQVNKNTLELFSTDAV